MDTNGKEVVNAMRAVVDTMEGPRLMFKDEIVALLAYIDALEDVVRAARGSVGVVLCWEYNEELQQKKECGGCGSRLICRALKKLQEMDKPLPTFEDVKGILADKEGE